MEFEEYAKIMIKTKDGKLVPLKLSRLQKRLFEMIKNLKVGETFTLNKPRRFRI